MVAEPPYWIGTVISRPEGPSSSTDQSTMPTDSRNGPAGAVRVTTGSGSSSVIEMMCSAGRPTIAFVAPRMSRMIVSSDSARRSSRSGIEIVWELEPAGIVTEVGIGPWSTPAVAVPLTARGTITSIALGAERKSVTFASPLGSLRICPPFSKKTVGRSLSSTRVVVWRT